MLSRGSRRARNPTYRNSTPNSCLLYTSAKIDRMVNSGNVKAIASVSLDGMFVVKNLKSMDGRKGQFVSMPQEPYSGKDGQKKYSNLFFALTNSAKLELQETVLQRCV